MRLRTNVFIWVFFATAVPVAVLALFATAYSERVYRDDVATQMFSALDRVTSEVGRRMLLEREAVLALEDIPGMTQFLPALARAAIGRLDPDFDLRRDRLTRFLIDFQSMIPSVSAVRILDADGTTVIKVQSGVASPPDFEGVKPYTYVEEQLIEEPMLSDLLALPRDGVSTVDLPLDDQPANGQPAALLDMVLPLTSGNKVLGFIVTTVRRGPINRLLQVMPRAMQGQLLIAELNSEKTQRDGLILFDERRGILLGEQLEQAPRLNELEPQLSLRAQTDEQGVQDSEDGGFSTFFVTYLPYPDHLTTWLIAMRVDKHRLLAPFTPIRYAIVAAVVLALLASLFFADLCARRIARPITSLSRSLIRYAHGERQLRAEPSGATEVREANNAFNELAQTLERAEAERDSAQALVLRNAKLAAVGQMAAGIGHEINNPINNILSLVKLAQRGASAGPQLIDDLRAIDDEARRISAIVTAVLDFARDLPAEFTAFEVHQWLSDAIGDVTERAKSRGIAITLDYDDAPTLVGNRDLLRQVLVNVLNNAVQASGRNSEVNIAVTTTDDNLNITVSDQGAGIAEDHLARVFDPFFTTKPVGEGTGMGLSLSLGIVHHHGGELTLGNSPSGGAVARIRLPFSPPGA